MALIKENEPLLLLNNGEVSPDRLCLITTPKVEEGQMRYQTFMLFNADDALCLVLRRTENGVITDWENNRVLHSLEIIYKDDQIFWAMCVFNSSAESRRLRFIPFTAHTQEEMNKKLKEVERDYVVIQRGTISRQEALTQLDKAKRT